MKISLSILFFTLFAPLAFLPNEATSQEEYEDIDSASCATCHETGAHDTDIEAELSKSIHEGLECQDCHSDKDVYPHREVPDFEVGYDGCGTCHQKAAEDYQIHGRASVKELGDIPRCSDCHGAHDILPPDDRMSRVHPINLPQTCGGCHEDINITKKYEILIDNPIEIYENSIHGTSTKGGVYPAATCDNCHSAGGTSHKILAPGYRESSINHFNIPKTCGQCHRGVYNDYMESTHGKLVARGETDAPVCTSCHGEHGILSHNDPRSPVSPTKIAVQTCSPCHESAVLNEKYGLQPGRLTSFIDSYHGLKSKAGDTKVANCASCHGVHRILPSTDPTSTIYPDNLQKTCGECHPGISEGLARHPVHGVGEEGLHTDLADLIARIYTMLIVIVIGPMALICLFDFLRQLKIVLRKRPGVRRMQLQAVWQHAFLAIGFSALVISGFALQYSESWFVKLFFGWSGGFELRGIIHRGAALLLIITALWHLLYVIFGKRGRTFFRDMLPEKIDFVQFWQRLMFNLGRRNEGTRFKRFSFIEKVEYWALIWGMIIMIVTGILLWFDNFFLQMLPKGAMDIALVIHFYEAWMATLAILIWHFYFTIFNPHVYPMNPSWLTGIMPEEMYEHEHPEDIDRARLDEKARIEKKFEEMSITGSDSVQEEDTNKEPGK